MADSFVSSALGQPYEYDAKWIEQRGLWRWKDWPGPVADLKCRPQGDSGPYVNLRHNQKQVQDVLVDMDKAGLGA
jgi:hypothetical protein